MVGRGGSLKYKVPVSRFCVCYRLDKKLSRVDQNIDQEGRAGGL
jgi:hypothetical protein